MTLTRNPPKNILSLSSDDNFTFSWNDELNIPKWFKELPFDHDGMEQSIIDQKVSNLMSELGWDLESTKTSTVFDNLFEAV